MRDASDAALFRRPAAFGRRRPTRERGVSLRLDLLNREDHDPSVLSEPLALQQETVDPVEESTKRLEELGSPERNGRQHGEMKELHVDDTEMPAHDLQLLYAQN